MSRSKVFLPTFATILLAGCASGGQSASATAPTVTAPEACTQYVLNAISAIMQPGDTDAQFNQVLNQATNDYGQSSAQYTAITDALHNTGFSNIRVARGLKAGLDYLQPRVSATCSAVSPGSAAAPSVDPN